MWILKKANLATKLFFSYLLLVIFPFFISTLVLSSTSSDNIETNTLSYIDLFVEQLSANMDNYIDSMDRMTKVVALDSELCEILTRLVNDDKATIYHQTQYLETQILQMMTQYPGIRNITFVGANGMIYSGPSNQIADEEALEDLLFSDDSEALNSTVIISKARLFKSTMDFNHTAIGLIALLMGIIILLSLYFSHKLLQPLKHLRNATNELAVGNYSIRIPVTSKDEIGDLCTRFNFMTEQTQNLMNRVYHYQLATKQAKLEALQNQINPHFWR